ncbi:MAG: low-complexity protein [Pseudomonadota bacterium]
MSDKKKSNKLSLALGTGFAVTLAASNFVTAAENPFAANEIKSGYMVADGHGEGKCGEGKCGEGKDEEGKCGEGKCGEGKDEEGKCGEGKCGS